jgi:acyl-CoA synthetase (AMP-forming)/AMP-acid ligase II
MFHGRYKDMLKVGGENVAAAEIEALLGRHPAVKLIRWSVFLMQNMQYRRICRTQAGKQRHEAELVSFASTRSRPSRYRVVRFIEIGRVLEQDSKFRLRETLSELGLA